jgi:hypothetical protein
MATGQNVHGDYGVSAVSVRLNAPAEYSPWGMAEVPYQRPCEDILSRIFHTQLSFLHTGEEGNHGCSDQKYLKR